MINFERVETINFSTLRSIDCMSQLSSPYIVSSVCHSQSILVASLTCLHEFILSSRYVILLLCCQPTVSIVSVSKVRSVTSYHDTFLCRRQQSIPVKYIIFISK